MNTYRILMIVFGLLVAVPNLIFLLKFRPPKNEIRWLAAGLRVKASALLATGVRTMWLNASNPNAGSSISDFDRILSAVLMFYVAFAACFFLFGYLWYREGGPGAQGIRLLKTETNNEPS